MSYVASPPLGYVPPLPPGYVDPVLQSMGPYAPFTRGSAIDQGIQLVGGDPASPEGRLATELLTDAVEGRHVDVASVASQAGAIAGGIVGSSAGPIGAMVGAVVGGIVGKAIGGLVGGGGDDCNLECHTNNMTAQLAPQVCTHRNGQVDPDCYNNVWQIVSGHLGCGIAVLQYPITHNPNPDCAGALAKYKQPYNAAGNEVMFRARLGEQAARVKIADDDDWARKVIILANTTAAQWGPKCSTGDTPCLDEIKGNAIQYAFNAHPFRQENSAAAEGPAYAQLQYAMNHAIGESKARVQGLQAGVDAKKAASAASSQAVSNKISDASGHRKVFLIGAGAVTVAALAYLLLD